MVKTAVETGHYGQFIPFFGVERKGSPVFGFLRLSEEEIRRKTQVYEPDVLIILDDTLVHLPATYAGLKEGGTVVINSVHDAAALQIPAQAGKVAIVDATTIAMEEIGRSIPNTAMLGAFAKATGLVDAKTLFDNISAEFGESNRAAAMRAYDAVQVN